MEQRRLGASGLMVPVLSFGTGTFGGKGALYEALGQNDAHDARRMIDLCLERGVTLFDSADVYSDGESEQLLGLALRGRRGRALISTKATFRTGEGPNDVGSSRHHLLRAVDASLSRLGTDYIDIFQLHAFDGQTPVEETLRALDDLVRAGKVRYVGCSNFAAWQLMKSLAVAERHGYVRYVVHQAYYSLVGRSYEWELMPIGLDQGVSALVWSPLAWGRLTGKLRRNEPAPRASRLGSAAARDLGPPVEEALLFRVLDALDAVAAELEASVPQVALAWLLTRPTVASLILGARNPEQLEENLAALTLRLSPAQLDALDHASALPPVYPYFHQAAFERNRTPLR